MLSSSPVTKVRLETALLAVLMLEYDNPLSFNSVRNSIRLCGVGETGFLFCLLQNTIHLLRYVLYCFFVPTLHEAMMMSMLSLGISLLCNSCLISGMLSGRSFSTLDVPLVSMDAAEASLISAGLLGSL